MSVKPRVRIGTIERDLEPHDPDAIYRGLLSGVVKVIDGGDPYHPSRLPALPELPPDTEVPDL